jgi:Uncharacterized protein conserved in bacteria (DUF2066)
MKRHLVALKNVLRQPNPRISMSAARISLRPFLMAIMLAATAWWPLDVVAAPSSNQDADIFTVLDVSVDATAKNAAAARVLARAQGHKSAYQRLIMRLVPRDRQRDVPRLDAEAVASLVSNFEVDAEKTSPIRYLGKLKFRFKRRAVTNFLRDAGIPFAVTRSKPLLVLPVYRSAGVYLLWDNPNPWRAAWAALPPADGLVPMIHPAGDLADVNDISAEQAVIGDVGRLRAIAGRYGAAGVVLALAVPSRDRASRRPVIQVTVTRFAEVGQDRGMVRGFLASPGQTMAELIKIAARTMSSRIEEDWKSDNLLRFGQDREILVRAPLTGLPDWIALARRLQEVAFIRKSALVALTRKSATIRLGFLGDEEQLALALAQQDVRLTRGPNSWILRMSGAGDAAKETVPDPTKQSREPR